MKPLITYTRFLLLLLFCFLGPFNLKIPAQGNNEITVSGQMLQQMRFGIDAERLDNYWHRDVASSLAELGVKEMDSDFVRVAINCAYELTEGEKDPNAYSNILNMMNAMKIANPDIKFFASPRPLWVAYGTKEGVPWTPYPMWVQEWSVKDTYILDGVEYNKWRKEDFHVEKLVKYYSDYLNLMHDNGFDISFLDLSNEQTIIKPWSTKYLYDSLPVYLNEGVHMPELVVPSTWSHIQATEWLKTVDTSKDEHLAFSVASAHNTGGDFLGEELVAEAKKYDKEVWNTEMHQWMGVDSKEEILTSDILWKHILAGFNGIDSWLFYGPYEGRGHTMIWVDPDRGIRKSTKYEIFKKLVNQSNRGYHLHSSQLGSETYSVSFLKEDVLTIWVLNASKSAIDSVKFSVEDFRIRSAAVETTVWNESTQRSGTIQFSIPAEDYFISEILGESLYCFKTKVTDKNDEIVGDQNTGPLIIYGEPLICPADTVIDDVYHGPLPDYSDSIQGIDNRDLNIIQIPAPGTMVQGINEVELTFIDGEDNLADTSIIIFDAYVQDSTIPVITSTYTDTIIAADENCQALLPDFTVDMTVTDQSARYLEFFQSPEAGSELTGNKENIVTLRVSDDSGNSSTVSFSIRIEDKTAPVIHTIYNDTDIEADRNGEALVFDYAEVMDVSDNCDWASELIISQNPDPYSVIKDTTEVVLTVTDMSGNSSQASFNINLTGDYVGIGLTDAENLLIYPNPTDGIIHFNNANRTIRHLRVTNIAGLTLIEKSGFSEQDFLDLSQLKSGVYLIRIHTDYNTQIRKIIKR